METPGEITNLLIDARKGERDAESKLMDLMYGELHRLAVRYMRGERQGHSLQPTELVNEAYLQLMGASDITFENRSHFLAVAARMMRRILIDHARSVNTQKRGGGQKVVLDDILVFVPAESANFIALDEALESLAQMDSRQAQIVELRYFGGLTNEETAAVLNVTTRTVGRDWRSAKAWLFARLNPEKLNPEKLNPENEL
jgi:RNA polymerase sigma factor (TIGR02999 family)